MASFFSKILSIFGGSRSANNNPSPSSGTPSAVPQLYGECTIFATPQREGNQFRLAGRIEKQVGGDILVRNFIRADLFTSADDAAETAFRKAHQIIDQHGASLFSDGEKVRQV